MLSTVIHSFSDVGILLPISRVYLKSNSLWVLSPSGLIEQQNLLFGVSMLPLRIPLRSYTGWNNKTTSTALGGP